MKLDDIVISKQNIRQNEDEEADFENLKESIKKESLIHRMVLRPAKEKGKYEVVAGGRRFRALSIIKPVSYELPESDYIIREDIDDDAALLISIEENTQRLEFTPLELNKAGLALNKRGMSDKEIAKKLNVTPHRLKRILNLSSDFNKMPEVVKEQLGKLSEDTVFTDKHWDTLSKKTDDPELIQEVAEYIIDKELPARDVPSIVKMIEKNKKEQDKQSGDTDQKSGDTGQKPAADPSDDPLEYKHKGELVLEEKGGKSILKVIGKDEDSEVPVEQYLNYLRNPDKFKCYVTFKLKIKSID